MSTNYSRLSDYYSVFRRKEAEKIFQDWETMPLPIKKHVDEWEKTLRLNRPSAKQRLSSVKKELFDESKQVAKTISKPSFRQLKTPEVSIAGLNTRFRIGIEFEGIVRTEIYDEFRAYMEDLGSDENGDSLIQFGVDHSVKNMPEGYQPVEIRTQIMRSKPGIVLFEEMLCFLYIASQTEDFLTNETCGLHINISEVNVFEADKQVDFYCHVLSHFEENKILDMFGRLDNKYCREFIPKGSNRDVNSVKHQYNLLKRREKAAEERGADKWAVNEGKYLAVSLRDSPVHDGYDGPERKQERIEFRCIGNKNYHLRFDELDETVNHIVSICRQAYREVYL